MLVDRGRSAGERGDGAAEQRRRPTSRERRPGPRRDAGRSVRRRRRATRARRPHDSRSRWPPGARIFHSDAPRPGDASATGARSGDGSARTSASVRTPALIHDSFMNSSHASRCRSATRDADRHRRRLPPIGKDGRALRHAGVRASCAALDPHRTVVAASRTGHAAAERLSARRAGHTCRAHA